MTPDQLVGLALEVSEEGMRAGELPVGAVVAMGDEIVGRTECRDQFRRYAEIAVSFDAFYVMSCTATTIGYGEIPYAFTGAQALALQRFARTVARSIEHRIAAFGSPAVVNPFDRYGGHLRIALRAPSSYQLMSRLESGPGAELPARGPAAEGRPTGSLRMSAFRA